MIPTFLSLALSLATATATATSAATATVAGQISKDVAGGFKQVDGRVIPDRPVKSPYGYTPSLVSCIAFIAVYGALTAVHLALALRHKYWSAIVTMVFGGVLEVLGWCARLWSHENVLMWENFVMQVCCLIIGPVFFSAWVYTVLGMVIRSVPCGQHYSLIGPHLYVVLFIIADIVALVLQAIGGGGAAVNARNYENTTKNTHVMLAGIAFQLGMMVIFAVLMLDFWVRYSFGWAYPAWWRNLGRRRGNKRNSRRTTMTTPTANIKESKSDSSTVTSTDTGTGRSETATPTPAASTCNSSTTAVEPASERLTRLEKTGRADTEMAGQIDKADNVHKANAVPDAPPRSVRTDGPPEAQIYAGAGADRADNETALPTASPPTPTPLRHLNPRSQFLLCILAAATTTIIVRGVYRTVELNEGWRGRIITTQRYFVWLDGFTMAVCMALLAVGHPGFLLPRRTWRRRWREEE